MTQFHQFPNTFQRLIQNTSISQRISVIRLNVFTLELGVRLMELVDDEEAFLTRVNSFRIETWFAKPSCVSPLICASRGWSNTGVNQLTCLSCNATLTFPSFDVDSEDEEDRVEAFVRSLEWEHDADCVWCEEQCPEEFYALEKRSNEKLRQESIVRFLRLNTLWDVPKIQSLNLDLDAFKAELRKIVDLDFDQEEWRSRIQVLTLLAVSGWELSVLDHKFGIEGVRELTELESGMELIQSAEFEEVEDLGYCFARQSVLHCKLCNAVFGLWTLPSEAFLSFEKFQEFAKSFCEKMNYSIVDMETGEVQDLFVKLNQYEMSPDSGEAPITGPVFDGPPFKKQRLESGEALPGNTEFLQNCVKSSISFQPVQNHRSCCPYRIQWNELMSKNRK